MTTGPRLTRHLGSAPRTRARWALFLVPLLGAVLVGGCAPQTSYYRGAETPKRNQVDLVRFAHDVTFPIGSAQVSEREVSRLANFLAQQGIGYGDEVAIAIPATPTEPVVASRQRQAVATMLADLGYEVRDGGATAAVPAAPGRVTVVVSRHVVTPPTCSYWSQKPAASYANLPLAGFGCATERNLGLMVANPADLLRGRPGGPADGEYATIGIQRYRAGETKPLESDATRSGAMAGDKM